MKKLLKEYCEKYNITTMRHNDIIDFMMSIEGKTNWSLSEGGTEDWYIYASTWQEIPHKTGKRGVSIIFDYDVCIKYDKEYTIQEVLEILESVNQEYKDFNFGEENKEIKLYHHKTDGGAEYLFDTFIEWEHEGKKGKEGRITDKTKYYIRLDGEPYLIINEE